MGAGDGGHLLLDLVGFVPPRARSPCLPLPQRHPSPPLLLSVGPRPTPRAALPSDGDVFWYEPDDGFGSDDEDGDEAEAEQQETTERRSSFSSFPSPSLFSRLDAVRRQEQREEQELRGEIELLLTPEEVTILYQNETADITKYIITEMSSTS